MGLLTGDGGKDNCMDRRLIDETGIIGIGSDGKESDTKLSMTNTGVNSCRYLLLPLLMMGTLPVSTAAAVEEVTSTFPANLLQRNVIIVAGSQSSNSSTPTNTGTAGTSTSISSQNSTATNASNSTNPYSLDIPGDSDSSGLKYLYFFFLIIGIIIIGLIVRWYIVKKRRARDLEKSSAVRSEALRLDMQSHNPHNGGNGNGEMIERGDRGSNYDDESFQPPPPYPTHKGRRGSGERGVEDEPEREHVYEYGSSQSSHIPRTPTTSTPYSIPTMAAISKPQPSRLPAYIEVDEENEEEAVEHERISINHRRPESSQYHRYNTHSRNTSITYDHNDDDYSTAQPDNRNHDSYYGVVNHYVRGDHSRSANDSLEFAEENDDNLRRSNEPPHSRSPDSIRRSTSTNHSK